MTTQVRVRYFRKIKSVIANFPPKVVYRPGSDITRTIEINFLKVNEFYSIKIHCCRSRIRCFRTPWSGSGISFFSGSNPHISEGLVTFFWLKLIKFIFCWLEFFSVQLQNIKYLFNFVKFMPSKRVRLPFFPLFSVLGSEIRDPVW
jgi:hypothetical protein